MGRRKGINYDNIAMELKNSFGYDYIEIKTAQKLLGYKSYPSFYSYIVKPLIERGLIEKPFRGVIKIKEY